MTIRTNETVIVYDDYSMLTLQDFEVSYVQNSFEEEQEMAFTLVNITTREITVNLTFSKPILVSQGTIADRVSVKLNKDLFLMPMKYQGGNTIMVEDE